MTHDDLFFLDVLHAIVVFVNGNGQFSSFLPVADGVKPTAV